MDNSYLTENALRLHYEANRVILSIGLWRLYINITITVLGNNDRPVFYLKHMMDNSYLTEIAFRLHYEPNRLMLSIALRRLYVNITVTVLDIISRSVPYLTHNVSKTWFCFRLQAKPIQFGLIVTGSLVSWVHSVWRRRLNAISQTSCKIWGFHGGDYEEWCLLGCYAVWLL
jgi:hypothetical protein